MSKKTIKVAICSILVLTGIICAIYLMNYFSPREVSIRKDKQRTELYRQAYAAFTDSCEKWNGTLWYNPVYYHIDDEDTCYAYLAILVEKYNTYDSHCSRRYAPCISGLSDASHIKYNAREDAKRDYLKNHYGDTLFQMVRRESRILNEKYKLHYYHDWIPTLVDNCFKREMVNDSVEIGILDIKGLDSIPFKLYVDTVHKNEYFYVRRFSDKIIFYPNSLSDDRPGTNAPPYVELDFFFDPKKTDFPYTKYSFRSVYLEMKRRPKI